MVRYIACPRDCYDTCRLCIEFDGSKPTRVLGDNNLITRGITCPRAARELDHVYSSLRVLYPAINVEKSGVFRRLDWDEALDIVVSRLREVLEVYGPQHVLFLDYAGNRGLITRHGSRRLWNYLRVARIDYTICDAGGAAALRYMYGSTYGVFPRDMESLRMVIVWGFNPAVSAVHMWRHILDVRHRGGVIVTIDLRRSETAKQSDLFVQVKPGSDGVLALGIAKYLIDNDMIDREFIARYVHGFEKFVEHISKYTLDYVEKVTGIAREKIIELAELMYRYRPFAIFIGYGIQRRRGGGEIVRAIATLPALLGIHRGFYYSNTDGLPINFDIIEGTHLGQPSRIISMEKVGELLSRGEFKFVYIHLHNPAATLPNSSKIVEGLKRRDVFVVVHDTHWSDTAKLADIVLPAPTFLEKFDVVYSYWHNYLYLNEPVIEPLGEALGEYHLMCELAKKLKISSYSDVCRDPIELLRSALGDETLDKLLREGAVELVPKPRNEYQTPTGRIELYSTKALEKGLPPLPSPPEGDEVSEHEFLLISSAHPLYIHTQFEDVYGSIPSYIHINPVDAERYGLRDGDLVEVYNDRGSIIMRVKIDENIGEKVLWVPRHARSLDGKRVSVLLDDGTEELGGGAVINSTRVKIRSVSETLHAC